MLRLKISCAWSLVLCFASLSLARLGCNVGWIMEIPLGSIRFLDRPHTAETDTNLEGSEHRQDHDVL